MEMKGSMVVNTVRVALISVLSALSFFFLFLFPSKILKVLVSFSTLVPQSNQIKSKVRDEMRRSFHIGQ